MCLTFERAAGTMCVENGSQFGICLLNDELRAIQVPAVWLTLRCEIHSTARTRYGGCAVRRVQNDHEVVDRQKKDTHVHAREAIKQLGVIRRCESSVRASSAIVCGTRLCEDIARCS